MNFHVVRAVACPFRPVATATPIVVIVPMSKIAQHHHHHHPPNVPIHRTQSVVRLDNGHVFPGISAFTANSGAMEGLIVMICLMKPIAVSDDRFFLNWGLVNFEFFF